jgi:predicted adenine nucleotide alpha hydrolase (AANH) superfamily ATPase
MRALLDEGHQVAGAFVNPNIHPYREFVARREAARQACETLNVPLAHEDGYGLAEFLRGVVGREEERCPICYKMRLERVAELASALGFEGFSTSMLVSTQQDHEAIVRAGEAAAAKHGVEFISRDFRPRVMDGVRESKERGLYRQQYCGCVYSEWERYREGA